MDDAEMLGLWGRESLIRRRLCSPGNSPEIKNVINHTLNHPASLMIRRWIEAQYFTAHGGSFSWDFCRDGHAR